MNFTIKNKQEETLYTGTKQECMHFIKCRKLNRQEITINKFDNKPTPHYAIPIIVEDETKPKNFFKRIFN